MVPPSIRIIQKYLLYLCSQLNSLPEYRRLLYTSLFTSIDGANATRVVLTGRPYTITAGVITVGVVMLLTMLLATPLFVRKYVVCHQQVAYHM